MAELKTSRTNADPVAFVAAIADPRQRADSEWLLSMMREATGEEPAMWGPSIVGFGAYHYEYKSGRRGEWFLTGFSPRKGNMTLYIIAGFDRYAELMARLGKHSTGQSCLYVKKLDDVDRDVLRELAAESARTMRAQDVRGAQA